MRRLLHQLALVVLAGLLLAAPTAAQLADWNPGKLELSRQDLNDLLARLEAVEASSAYGGDVRRQARESIGRVQKRLAEGDFRIGDAVVLTVENEPQLSGTFPVRPGPLILPPEIGEISLAGVLRSELTGYLTQEIGRFVRNPVVQSRSMVRISVQGAVTTPGFYLMPAEELISEALMRAGGPAGGADLNQMRVERAQQIVWQGPRLQQELVAGRTLDQLGLLAGDQIVVPTANAPTSWFDRSLLVAGLAATILTTVTVIN